MKNLRPWQKQIIEMFKFSSIGTITNLSPLRIRAFNSYYPAKDILNLKAENSYLELGQSVLVLGRENITLLIKPHKI